MKFKIIVSFVLAGLVSACGSNEPELIRQAKRLLGRKIELPVQYVSVPAAVGTVRLEDELAKPYKIITYLDRNACTKCALSVLKDWEEHLRDIPKEQVGFIPVIYPIDRSELKMVVTALQLEYPLLYDVDNKFIDKNKLGGIRAVNRSFLLDSHSRIVVIGEPLNSGKLWMLYKNTLNTLSGTDGRSL